MHHDMTCICGETAWRLTFASPRAGAHIKCYCTDCQAFARHTGHGDVVMDENGGTPLFQILPEGLTFPNGTDNIALLRLSPRGLFRWHTTCCNTPVANTAPSIGVPFTIVFIRDHAKPFGRVVCQVNAITAMGLSKVKTFGVGRLVFRFATRAISARLSGRYKLNALFNSDTRKPIKTPVLISKQDKAAAYTR